MSQRIRITDYGFTGGTCPDRDELAGYVVKEPRQYVAGRDVTWEAVVPTGSTLPIDKRQTSAGLRALSAGHNAWVDAMDPAIVAAIDTGDAIYVGPNRSRLPLRFDATQLGELLKVLYAELSANITDKTDAIRSTGTVYIRDEV